MRSIVACPLHASFTRERGCSCHQGYYADNTGTACLNCEDLNLPVSECREKEREKKQLCLKIG